MAVIEVIRARNDLVAGAGAACLRELFGILWKERMLRAAGDGEMRATKPAGVRPHVVVLVLAVLVDVGCGGKKRDRAARHRPKKLFAFSLGDQRFGLLHSLPELGLRCGAGRIKLFWTGARDHADYIAVAARALVKERLDTTETMADEDETLVALFVEFVERAIVIFFAVLELFVGRAAEIEEVAAGAVDPIVTASVDDEAMITLFGEGLSESRQRRQIKIHRDAVHEQQSEIGPLLARRKQQAVQSFVIAGFEIEKLRIDTHSGVSLPLTSPSKIFFSLISICPDRKTSESSSGRSPVGGRDFETRFFCVHKPFAGWRDDLSAFPADRETAGAKMTVLLRIAIKLPPKSIASDRVTLDFPRI